MSETDTQSDDTRSSSPRGSIQIRELAVESPALTVALGVTGLSLVGQLIPPGGTVEISATETPRGTAPPRLVQVDDLGCFVVDPLPQGSFRLRCTSATGEAVVTDLQRP